MTTTGSLARPAVEAPRRFLGWQVLGVAFLAQVFANGVTLSAFSNFVLPLSNSFSVSRGTITLGTTIAIASMGILGPFVGRLVDRGHARRMMTIGSLLSGLGLILMSQAQDLRVLTFWYGGFVCVGAALFGVMPSSAIAANWFVRRRGFALGVTFAGATVVSLLAPIGAQYLIDTQGWRVAILSFGVALLLFGVPIFALFTVGRPEDVGQRPDGDSVDLEPVALSGILTPAELARDPRLWLIALGFGLILTSPILLLTLLIPYATGLGFTGQQANLFFAAMAPVSLLGKLVLGALADRSPAKPIIALVVVMNAAVWLIFYSVPSYSLYLTAGVLYGIGIGGAAPLQGVVMGRCFGRANFGTANGLGGILVIGLLVMSTVMSSLLQGENGEGYPVIFLIQTILLVLGGVLLACVRIPDARDSVDFAG